MKATLLAALMIPSVSFAHYSCDEKDSTLNVKFTNSKDIEVTHVSKRPSRLPLTKVFKGQIIDNDSSGYFKVENFKLKPDATLKVTTIPVMTRVPTCRTRVCDDIGGSYSKFEISAELDEAGKLTHYDCQKF